MARQIVVQIVGDADKLSKTLDSASMSAGKFGVAAGVGAKIASVGFDLVNNAVSGAVDFLAGSVRAAEENEVAYTKLTTALKANVPGWDGNTEAIMKANEAGAKLGFTDKEMADSLATLVAATHDVSKAEDIRSTAMDLARFKGISLQDATDALTKVEAGSYRILKSLGIELGKGATQTDALTAVRRVAGGQAEAYSKTSDGLRESLRAETEAMQEQIGTKMLPFLNNVTAAELGFLNAIEAVTAGLDAQNASSPQNVDFWRQMAVLVPPARDLFNGTADALAKLDYQAAVTAIHQDGLAGSTRALKDDYTGAWASIGKASDDIIPGIVRDIATIPAAFDYAALRGKVMVDSIHHNLTDARSTTKTDADALAQAMLDPIAGPKRKQEIEDDLTGKSSLGKQLAAGLQSSDPIVREAAKKLQQDLKDELRGLAIEYAVNFNTKKDPSAPHKASGGPVEAGHAYVVGEVGEELFVPESDGSIIPNNRLGRGGRGPGGGGGDVHIHIDRGAFIDGPAIDALANRITQRLRFAKGT